MTNRTRTSLLLLVGLILTGCSSPGGLSLGTSPAGVTLDVWWDPDTGDVVATDSASPGPEYVPLLVVPEPPVSPGVWSFIGEGTAKSPAPARSPEGALYGRHDARPDADRDQR
jgi:hypothetical protein